MAWSKHLEMLVELRKACKITRPRLVFRALFLTLATSPRVWFRPSKHGNHKVIGYFSMEVVDPFRNDPISCVIYIIIVILLVTLFFHFLPSISGIHPDNTLTAEDIDNWGGGGAHINIFVFTDCKNNQFQKKLIVQNTNICEYSPSQLLIFRRPCNIICLLRTSIIY